MSKSEPPDADEIADNTLRLLRGEGDHPITRNGPPISWRELTAEEASEEWPQLYTWVEHLRVRYPNSLRLPDCWWRHTDLIEPLAALRDFERGCFGPKAAPIAAVEWQRAFRDIEARLEVWVRRLPCAVAGRGHEAPYVIGRLPEGWREYVGDDVNRRAAKR